jgi:hypothetical protein
VRESVREEPLTAALIVASWFALTTAVAVAAKVVETDPVGTVTGEGTLRLLLLLPTVTAVPPEGAISLRVTVQVDVPRVGTEPGLQIRLAICVAVTAIVSPIPERVRLDAVGVAPRVLASVKFVVPAAGAIVIFAVATTPLAIVFSFAPVATHL